MQRIQLAEVNEAADLHTVNEELRQQHFLVVTFFPSLPVPILAKSRGCPSRGRDFARIGRRREGGGAARTPALWARICQSEDCKIHKLLGSQHGVDCKRGCKKKQWTKKKIVASTPHTLQGVGMAAGLNSYGRLSRKKSICSSLSFSHVSGSLAKHFK